MVRRGEELDNLRTGYDAELAVGQELDRLMRQGTIVFHDFPADGFNLDHGSCSGKGKGRCPCSAGGRLPAS
jgi:hypothetical protein